MEEVRGDFNRALAMLHSFWYQRSEAAFTAIARKDPDCAMAHWGVAMSRFHPLWERPQPEDLQIGQKALEIARAAGVVSDRERGYINALGRFYEKANESDHLRRMVAYEEAMQDLSQRYADDSEAAIFHALAVLGVAYASPADGSYARQKKAGAILEKMLAKQPDHPGVVHYIIHSYDFPPLADGALDAARRYALVAPAAPHALHMPSHIFTRLGLWQESIASNRKAAKAARENQWTGEELHATDYLVYAFLQRAQDGEARAIRDGLSETGKGLKSGIPNYFAGVYAMAAIPARYAVERRQWEEASRLPVPTDVIPGESQCWAGAVVHFARGLGAVHTKAPDVARQSIAELERCREVLIGAKEDLWAKQVEVARRAVVSWAAFAAGNEEEALVTLRSAADLEDATDKHPVTPGPIVPARELLGEMLLDVKQPKEALTEFETALRDAPNRFRSLHGAARAAELIGDHELASEYYTKLLEIGRFADTERIELREAELFLKRVQSTAPRARSSFSAASEGLAIRGMPAWRRCG